MRLTRTGAKKRPSYRVIVADSSAPRDGRHVQILGYYDPMTKPSTIKIDTEKAVQWLRNGAQPTDRVRVLLRHSGVLKVWEERRLEDKRAHKEEAGAREESRAARMAHAAERRAARAARAVAGAVEPVAGAAKPVARAARGAAKAAAGAVEAVAEAVGLADGEETKPARGGSRRKSGA
jgi:small subunit ribosomal protein S16